MTDQLDGRRAGRARDPRRGRRPPDPRRGRHAVGRRRRRARSGCGSCSTPDPTSPSRSGRRSAPSWATTRRPGSTRWPRTIPPRSARCSWSIVGGYYTDRDVRDRIGYPGQAALTIRSWEYPAYLEDGLIDAVLARGPVWRDPATGQRAIVPNAPQTYAERFAEGEAAEGGPDGHDGA